MQRWQARLPLNPEGFAGLTPDSAFNTAVSFVTNTNWQGYGGETSMSYPTQMLGLTVQNFVSAATGMAVLVALMHGFMRKEAGGVDVLLLDKTGTITLGNRQASAFLPARGVKEAELADAAQLASLADETPEGRSIVVLAKQRFALRGREDRRGCWAWWR